MTNHYTHDNHLEIRDALSKQRSKISSSMLLNTCDLCIRAHDPIVVAPTSFTEKKTCKTYFELLFVPMDSILKRRRRKEQQPLDAIGQCIDTW